MVTDPTLHSEYIAASQTRDPDAHRKFIEHLMRSPDGATIEPHSELLRDRQNVHIYTRLRVAFKKYGAAGEAVLVERLGTETSPEMLADIIHLLGGMRSASARGAALAAIDSPHEEIRRTACYVLGWIGTEHDMVTVLHQRLLSDPNNQIRSFAATSYRQIFYRIPEVRERALKDLKEALVQEADPVALGGIIVRVQTLMRRRVGLIGGPNEPEIKGDVVAAREKALHALRAVEVPRKPRLVR